MRFIHFSLHIVLTAALILSVYEATKAKRNENEATEHLNAAISERNNLIRERNDLMRQCDEFKSQITKASANTSKLRDMLAFHMRACR